jgi:PAS domain S-box-containing protein
MTQLLREIFHNFLYEDPYEFRDKFFELSIDMFCIAKTDGYFHHLNPAFEQVLGYTADELLEKPFIEFVHPDDRDSTYKEMEKLLHGISTIHFENRYRCKDGGYKWLSWRCIPHPTGNLYATARDVTFEHEIQVNVQNSLKEKEILLKEVHHRVKNNLQVISSLINMQTQKLGESSEARAAFAECQARIQAISFIHEKLYQSMDYAHISFQDYIQSLTNEIFRISQVSPDQVTLKLDVDNILLPVNKAIPCGLILNELITNSFKHGFPGDRKGLITVRMKEVTTNRITMVVEDNGVGLPDSFDIHNSPSMGLQLVCTLTDQLSGKIVVNSQNGATFTITFSKSV